MMSKIGFFLGLLWLVWCLATGGAVAQMPGDANCDSVVDIGDVVYEINYLFKNGPSPVFYECGDPNADCLINVGDVLCLVNYLFRLGDDPRIVECGWSEPVNLGPIINSSAGQVMFRLSPDGRIAVWSSNRSGSYGNDDIWYSYWDSVSGSWSEPHNSGPNVNNGAIDAYPSLSPDGKRLYCLLYARDGDPYSWKVWASDWDSLHNEWGPIESLGPPFNTMSVMSPFISPDGTKLYFAKSSGIWISEWHDTGWGGPVSLGPNVNQNLFESDPTVTADSKTLYFSRYNYTAYICVSHWTGMEWGPAVALGPQINNPSGAEYPYITPNGSKLYFCSARPGGYGICDIWMSERIPVKGNQRTKDISRDTSALDPAFNKGGHMKH